MECSECTVLITTNQYYDLGEECFICEHCYEDRLRQYECEQEDLRMENE